MGVSGETLCFLLGRPPSLACTIKRNDSEMTNKSKGNVQMALWEIYSFTTIELYLNQYSYTHSVPTAIWPMNIEHATLYAARIIWRCVQELCWCCRG